MDDTRPEVAEKVREMFQMKSPDERLKMGLSMHKASKYLVAQSIFENSAVYSVTDLRRELFLKFYGDDFDVITREKILDWMGSSSGYVENEISPDFAHIPEAEKQQTWWQLLRPLVRARQLREKPGESRLLQVLSNPNGFRTWKDIKSLTEIALENVRRGHSILARTSEIKKSPKPDDIIDDMFAELRTVPYLLAKGFTDISYSRRDGLDFKATFDGKEFFIESTYVHGPDFKTQEYVFTTKTSNPIYRIRPDKLIRLFERTYLKKEKQILRSNHAQRTLLFMITDLEESDARWLEHAKVQNNHPILHLILSWSVSTVIFGNGSVYEPQSDALGGVFGKLHPFEWQSFVKSCQDNSFSS